MAELWGDDDYLYGDYLKWRRRRGRWVGWLLLILLTLSAAFLAAVLIWQ